MQTFSFKKYFTPSHSLSQHFFPHFNPLFVEAIEAVAVEDEVQSINKLMNCINIDVIVSWKKKRGVSRNLKRNNGNRIEEGPFSQYIFGLCFSRHRHVIYYIYTKTCNSLPTSKRISTWRTRRPFLTFSAVIMITHTVLNWMKEQKYEDSVLDEPRLRKYDKSSVRVLMCKTLHGKKSREEKEKKCK